MTKGCQAETGRILRAYYILVVKYRNGIRYPTEKKLLSCHANLVTIVKTPLLPFCLGGKYCEVSILT